MLEFNVGASRLRVIGVTKTGDVELYEFRNGERLVLLVPAESILDDGVIAHFCFTRALAARGLLASVRDEDLAALALDLAEPAEVASEWLRDSNVTVAVLGAPAELVAAVVLSGEMTVGKAVEAVRRLTPEALMTPDEEVTVSVAKDHMVRRRDIQRRRLQWVAQGGSPWDIR